MTERHLDRAGKLEQSGDAEAGRAPADARRDEGWGAVRPLQRQPHVLAGRVLYVHIAPAILAADEPSDRQRHSLEGVDRQRDSHALR
jgi:hypothetical protein